MSEGMHITSDQFISVEASSIREPGRKLTLENVYLSHIESELPQSMADSTTSPQAFAMPDQK